MAIEKNIRLKPHKSRDLLVSKKSNKKRPKYQPPGHVDAAPSKSSGGGGGPHGGGAWSGPTYSPPKTVSFEGQNKTTPETQKSSVSIISKKKKNLF